MKEAGRTPRSSMYCFPIRFTRGLQRDVVYLGGPIAPSYMSPNAGEGGSCGVAANQCNCTHEAK
jgi:hypothetical protein